MRPPICLSRAHRHFLKVILLMKPLPFLFSLLLALCSSVLAQETVPSKPSKNILEGPALSADEKTKIRFSAQVVPEVTPPSFDFRIYNGLRDKTLMGLVVRVATKNSEGQPVETDVFASVVVPPLQTVSSNQSYFVDFGNATREATFTLMEVLFEKGKAPASP